MKRIFLFLMAFILIVHSDGQTVLISHSRKDTSYIKDYYSKYLIIRGFESTNFYDFKLIDRPGRLVYKPNDHNDLGAGFNYRFISTNLSFYAPFISKTNPAYGYTHIVDLQTHLYLHKFIIDIYGQFYRGYFLTDGDDPVINFSNEKVILRPDIYTRDVSVVFEYVCNDKRFSYTAPFYQNEKQKKSSGSFLLGGGIYHSSVSGDSALAPSEVTFPGFYHNLLFKATTNSSIGLNAGYAYTFVIKKQFFISASLCGGPGLNQAEVTIAGTGNTLEKTGPEFNFTGKFSGGYNSDNYFAGITYIRQVTELNGVINNSWQEVNAGNFRLIFAKRIHFKKSLIPKTGFIREE